MQARTFSFSTFYESFLGTTFSFGHCRPQRAHFAFGFLFSHSESGVDGLPSMHTCIFNHIHIVTSWIYDLFMHA